MSYQNLLSAKTINAIRNNAEVYDSLTNISVTFPKGGEKWRVSSTQAIEWTSSGVINVKLEYSIDNGNSWIVIAEEQDALMGFFFWQIPYTYSEVCKVRVSNQADQSITDESDSTFSIYAANADIIMKFVSGSQAYNGTTVKYRLFVPADYSSDKKYPLVLTLHGLGERGSDNFIQISNYRIATAWADPKNQVNYPCIVVSPQCPATTYWSTSWGGNIETNPISPAMATVLEIVNKLIAEYSIDTTRLYITGLSMGGYGTLDLIMRYPDKFAAAIPMSGGADTANVKRIVNIPMWDFHGAVDYVVPVSLSRNIMNKFKELGRTVVYTHCNGTDCTGLTESAIQNEIDNGADLLYTEYQNGGHAIWDESYDNPLLIPWVFSQHKTTTSVEENINDIEAINNFKLIGNYPNPFNPTTKIKFAIPVETLHSAEGGTSLQYVALKVYDILGNEVATLVDEIKDPGIYEVEFSGNNLSSGIYFYRLKSGGFSSTKKMLLIK